MMAVEISIITGSRKGERVELKSDLIRIGDDPSGEIYFNPEDDPEAEGRRAVIVLEDSGWRIRKTGSRPLWVNQNAVEGSTPLRSGDTIRMSEMGPDLRFKLISARKAVAVSGDEPQGVSDDSQETGAVDDTDQPDAHTAEPSSTRGRLGLLIGVAGMVLVAVVAILMRGSGPEGGQEPDAAVAETFHLRDIPAQIVKEGQALNVTIELSDATMDANNVEFTLDGQTPAGMEIDSRTGQIQWTPSEQQGPGEYSLTAVAVTRGEEGELRDSKPFTVTVKEVNEPPWIAPISFQILDVEHSDTLRLKVEANDPDFPVGNLTFFLGSGAPDGAVIDAQTGQLSWTPTAVQRGRRHNIPVCVKDDGPDPRSSQTAFQVMVTKTDAWTTANKAASPAVCLLVAVDPKTGTAFPYGCACAIRNDALLTSGALAFELEKRRRAGWEVRATWPEQAQMLAVRDIKTHLAFNQTADSPEEQIYWDLAIITVDGTMAATAALAGPEDLAELERGMQLGCLAIAHTAEPLTRFDTPVVELLRVKMFGQLPLVTTDGATQAGAPNLLCLTGTLPDKIHGSPIINQAGKVLGVYAEKAYIPEGEANQSSNLHYAAETDLVRAWLAGQGTEYWKAPEWQSNN